MSSSQEAQELIDRAEALLTARQVHAAHEAFLAAERQGWNPDHCSGGRWLASMLAGDFEAAWREGDAIRARGTPDEHRFWQGEDLQGKRVIVRCLHGFGDAVQMLRLAPELAARARSVLYEVPPRFLQLAACFAGVQDVVTWGEQAPGTQPAWDVQLEVMELPYLLRLDSLKLPYASRYLRLPEKEAARVRASMGAVAGKPRVGLVWTCGEWNPTRGVPADQLGPLLASAEVEFWSLEGSPLAAETDRLGIRNANAVCGDGLLALAATISYLDLVISVDTLAAHLAGALGKPVWLLLQHAADWRWMVGRDDSPWYPTMRIFRQPQPGNWPAVISDVAETLQSFVRQGRLASL